MNTSQIAGLQPDARSTQLGCEVRFHHRARPRCLCQAPRPIVRYVPVPHTVVRYVPRTVVRYVPAPRPVHRAPPPRPRPPAGERG